MGPYVIGMTEVLFFRYCDFILKNIKMKQRLHCLQNGLYSECERECRGVV